VLKMKNMIDTTKRKVEKPSIDTSNGLKKVAINRCYGGFGLSPKATKLYLKKLNKKCYFYKQTSYKHQGKEEYTRIDINDLTNENFFISVYTKDMGEKISKHSSEYCWYESFYENRDDKLLIEVVEELGEKEASGNYAELKIVEIPDDVEWEISEYDGMESVDEKHRSW